MTSYPTDPITLTQDLIRCKSITPDEGGALDYLENILTQAGFNCHRLPFTDEGTPEVDNLYARIGTESPHLCFAGHTDVVPPGDESLWSHPPFAGTIEDDILFGRGTADMKGAIACFLSAVLDHLKGTDGLKAGSISFLITGDEEGPAINGTRKMLAWLKDKGEVIDHCLVGEPTNPDELGQEIKVGRRGSLNGVLTVNGTRGHVAYPHLANNPITGLNAVISTLLDNRLDDGNDYFIPSNLEFTSIDIGNPAENVIPEQATAKFNIRFNNLHNGEGLINQLEETISATLTPLHLTHEIKFRLSGESFLTEQGLLTETLLEAVKDITHRTPEFTTGGGTSDARFIKDICPVVEFGLLNKTIHMIDEQVPTEHLEQLTKIYGNFMRRYFELPQS